MKPAHLVATGGLLLPVGLTIAFGAPDDWLPDVGYYPYVAAACIVLGLAAFVAAGWIQVANARRGRQTARLSRAVGERGEAIGAASRGRSSFSALSAKERELTSVRRELAAALDPSRSLTLYGSGGSEHYQYLADIEALKARVKALENEIRALDGDLEA